MKSGPLSPFTTTTQGDDRDTVGRSSSFEAAAAPAKVLGIGRRKGSSALWNTEILGDRRKPNLIALRDTSS
jgi:hypothetical protein